MVLCPALLSHHSLGLSVVCLLLTCFIFTEGLWKSSE